MPAMVQVSRMLEQPEVSIIIVNFNAGPLLERAVHAALSSTVRVEVLVGDNGSHDGSFESLRKIARLDTRLRLFANATNLGFAKGCNGLFTEARGNYVLVLNPDAIIQPDTLKRLLETLRMYPKAGMAGCLIRNPDGSEQAGCRRAVPTPWRSFVRVLGLRRVFSRHPRFRDFLLVHEPLPAGPVTVEAISGAFMLVRRELMEQIGVFDDQYFMHCEDLDWCMRARRAGWDILFVPDVEIVHYKGTCSSDRPIFVLWHKHKGMVRFYRKFFRHQYPMALMWSVGLAVWMRFAVLTCLELAKRARRSTGKHEAPRDEVIGSTLVVAPASRRDERPLVYPAGTVARPDLTPQRPNN